MRIRWLGCGRRLPLWCNATEHLFFSRHHQEPLECYVQGRTGPNTIAQYLMNAYIYSIPTSQGAFGALSPDGDKGKSTSLLSGVLFPSLLSLSSPLLSNRQSLLFLFVLVVKTMVRVSWCVYMRAYVFVDDSKDVQATSLHKAGTGEFRDLDFLTRPAHSRQTPFDVA
jgi:hypothetical protein